MWVNIGDALAANTTLVTRTVVNDTTLLGKHRMNNAPSTGIVGTGKEISSILQFRLYRDGANVLDTYAHKAYLSEMDVHFEIDTIGSKTSTSK